MATRKEILDKAFSCVNGDRDQQYGSPEDSFKLIAKFWNAYLNSTTGKSTEELYIRDKDVASMLALLKIARIASGKSKEDNWIDLAGYAACGGEIDDYDDTSDILTNGNIEGVITKRLSDHRVPVVSV